MSSLTANVSVSPELNFRFGCAGFTLKLCPYVSIQSICPTACELSDKHACPISRTGIMLKDSGPERVTIGETPLYAGLALVLVQFTAISKVLLWLHLLLFLHLSSFLLLRHLLCLRLLNHSLRFSLERNGNILKYQRFQSCKLWWYWYTRLHQF